MFVLVLYVSFNQCNNSRLGFKVTLNYIVENELKIVEKDGCITQEYIVILYLFNFIIYDNIFCWISDTKSPIIFFLFFLFIVMCYFLQLM